MRDGACRRWWQLGTRPSWAGEGALPETLIRLQVTSSWALQTKENLFSKTASSLPCTPPSAPWLWVALISM